MSLSDKIAARVAVMTKDSLQVINSVGPQVEQLLLELDELGIETTLGFSADDGSITTVKIGIPKIGLLVAVWPGREELVATLFSDGDIVYSQRHQSRAAFLTFEEVVNEIAWRLAQQRAVYDIERFLDHWKYTGSIATALRTTEYSNSWESNTNS